MALPWLHRGNCIFQLLRPLNSAMNVLMCFCPWREEPRSNASRSHLRADSMARAWQRRQRGQRDGDCWSAWVLFSFHTQTALSHQTIRKPVGCQTEAVKQEKCQRERGWRITGRANLLGFPLVLSHRHLVFSAGQQTDNILETNQAENMTAVLCHSKSSLLSRHKSLSPYLHGQGGRAQALPPLHKLSSQIRQRF